MSNLVESNLFSSAVRTSLPKERRNKRFFTSKKVKEAIVAYESQIEWYFFMQRFRNIENDLDNHSEVLLDYARKSEGGGPNLKKYIYNHHRLSNKINEKEVKE